MQIENYIYTELCYSELFVSVAGYNYDTDLYFILLLYIYDIGLFSYTEDCAL